MDSAPVFQKVADCGVVAVLVIDNVDHAIPVARALVRGGVHAMELTLRTDAAMESLRRIRAEVPEIMAGIGTILSPRQVEEVAAAGAAFGVSPGLNPEVVAAACDQGLPFAPGVVTPSDVERALAFDLRTLKFFPAEPAGGLSYLRALAAPYAHLGVRYLPLGGIGPANLTDYLRAEEVAAVGGSWLVKKQDLEGEDWATIETKAREAAAAVVSVRNPG